MSQPNEGQSFISDENRISINEHGEVIINDPALAAATSELSDEELDEIDGGATNGSQCYCKVM
jgi:hypothetical protein